MKKILNLTLVFAITTLLAQSPRTLTRQFLQNPAVARAITGIHVTDLQTGREIVGVNQNRLFIPASTLKTLYVFTALDSLGDLFTWKTELLLTGKIRHDTLRGNIIIRSWGDPAFGGQADPTAFPALLKEMTRALRSAGIKAVQGNLELQIPANPYPAHGSWPVEDIGNYYGTGYWGFNFNDNTYKLYLDARETGKVPAVVQTVPDIPRLHIYNLARTGTDEDEDSAYLYGDPTSFTRTLIGTVPRRDSLFVLKGGIPYPPLSFIMIFKNALEREGITFDGKWFVRPKHKTYPQEQVFWSHVSAPLIRIAKTTLNKSVNLYSEALARHLVEKNAMQTDRYIDKDSLNAYFHKLGFRRIDLEDGSGLAPDNLIAPSEFTAFLRRRVRTDGLERTLDILPHAGEEGYARFFMKNSPLQKNIWLKSGSVSKVHNYIGIFKTPGGKYYAFAVMVNHFDTSHKEVKKAIENYLENLMKALDKTAK